jgi:hypothetical protein
VNPVIPQSYQPLMLGLMVLSGLIAWAAGYRLFRVVLTLNGFIFGAWVTTAMFGASDRTLLVFAALAGGAVGALIMFFGYFVGVALVGAGIGALAVHMFWGRLGTDPHPVVVILGSVAGAASAMALQRYPLDPAPSRRWVITAWAALGLAGIFIQLRFTGRTKAKVKKMKKPATAPA